MTDDARLAISMVTLMFIFALIGFLLLSAAAAYVIPWLFEVGAKRRAKRDAKIMAEQDAASARLVEMLLNQSSLNFDAMFRDCPELNQSSLKFDVSILTDDELANIVRTYSRQETLNDC